jgi:hypothetical protein
MDLQQDSRAFWASGSLDLRGAVDMLIIFQLQRSDQVRPSGLTECRSIIVRSAQKMQQASARPWIKTGGAKGSQGMGMVTVSFPEI